MEGHRPSIQESNESVEKRKQDHIKFSLDPEVQTRNLLGLDQIRLQHNALPEIDFEDISIADSNSRADSNSDADSNSNSNSKSDSNSDANSNSNSNPNSESVSGADSTDSKTLFSSVYFVASMTAGHMDAQSINRKIASAADEMSWPFAVGSQRRELYDVEERKVWKDLRKDFPSLTFFANLGLSQIIHASIDDVKAVIDGMEAKALMIHTNPLQEALQEEGTPNFKGGLKALENLCRNLDIPVILKETGCGFSRANLKSLNNLGLFAVDLSGLGGTHWGRIEGRRNSSGSIKARAAEVFKDWGTSTLESLLNAYNQKLSYDVWASGGIRSGLDAAKAIALGAKKVSVAQPIMQAALSSEEEIVNVMKAFEYELKVAMFCVGTKDLSGLRQIANIVNYQKLLEGRNV